MSLIKMRSEVSVFCLMNMICAFPCTTPMFFLLLTDAQGDWNPKPSEATEAQNNLFKSRHA